MPRYFFHSHTMDRVIRDQTGLDLPALARSEDPEMTLALWYEVIIQHIQRNQSLVVTDETGKVVFVAGG
jgi:hypothetical protein